MRQLNERVVESLNDGAAPFASQVVSQSSASDAITDEQLKNLVSVMMSTLTAGNFTRRDGQTLLLNRETLQSKLESLLTSLAAARPTMVETNLSAPYRNSQLSLYALAHSAGYRQQILATAFRDNHTATPGQIARNYTLLTVTSPVPISELTSARSTLICSGWQPATLRETLGLCEANPRLKRLWLFALGSPKISEEKRFPYLAWEERRQHVLASHMDWFILKPTEHFFIAHQAG